MCHDNQKTSAVWFFKSNKKADVKILNAITASTIKLSSERAKLIAQQRK
jgi:hypothetical protein